MPWTFPTRILRLRPLLVTALILSPYPLYRAGTIAFDDASASARSAPRWYPKKPTTFGAASDRAMGLALADLNGDGFPDIVVGSGSDLKKQRILVFYNDKRGKFQSKPDWHSEDSDFHTGVAVGDLDHDGWNDIAVSVGPQPNTGEPGFAKVYYNHQGVLDKKGHPIDIEGGTSVGCAIGDADGDANLDLVVAVAQTKSGRPAKTRVHTAPGGVLSASPQWLSKPVEATGATFADIDSDGLLDLVLAAPTIPVYHGQFDNSGKVALGRDPLPLTQDSIRYPISLDVGRAGTGSVVLVSYSDFVVSNGNGGGPSHGGSSKCAPASVSQTHFVGYFTGSSEHAPWVSKSAGWGFGVALADVDGDNSLDLIAARSGPSLTAGPVSPLQIYRGDGTSFNESEDWHSNTCTTQQFVAVADLARANIKESTERFAIDKPRAVVTLSQQVIDQILEVRRDGKVVDKRDYATIPGDNWISFAKTLQPRELIEVRYAYSTKLDIVVTNLFEPSAIYYHQ